MNFRSCMLGILTAAALVIPAAAQAADGFVRSMTGLRAGPGGDYPRITTLYAGTPLEVYGCIAGYSWCDVQAGPWRGWFDGNRIDFVYQGRRVLLPSYAPMAGVAILSFGMQDYWDRYYYDRPWYRERRWQRPTFRPRPDDRPRPPQVDDRPRPPRPDFDRKPVRPPQVDNRPPRPPVVDNRPPRPPRPDFNQRPIRQPQADNRPPRQDKVRPQQPQQQRQDGPKTRCPPGVKCT